MKTAAYIGKLASAGIDLELAQAHGEALEQAVTEDFVTKDDLDARLTELEGKVRMEIYSPGEIHVGLCVPAPTQPTFCAPAPSPYPRPARAVRSASAGAGRRTTAACP